MKQVKTSPLSKNFYFTTIDYVRLHNKLPNLSMSKQLRNYKLKHLRDSGVLIKLGYGTWGIDEDKVKEVKTTLNVSTKRLKKNIRSHGFVLTFKIPNIPGWHKLKNFLDKKDIKYKSVGIRNSGTAFIHKGHKLHAYKNSIIIYSDNSFYNDNAEDGYIQAINSLIGVFKSLEILFSYSLKVEGAYRYKVSRQHHAKVNDALAKYYRSTGQRLAVYDNNGLWLITDYSLRQNETETVHKRTATNDMDKIMLPFLNGLKEHYNKTGEAFSIDKFMQMHYTQFKTQQIMGQNIENITNLLNKLVKQLERS